jgi:putative ATPase
MIYAGEDPRFILRRMLILAGEDVGLADPQAVVVVNACAAAFDRVGMPEGRYPLAQAALYLATAPKSNSVMGFFDALAAVERERESEVPTHLRDANRDKQGFGHGAGYLYPHAYRDHWVEQQYLPQSLQGQVFYQPSDQGYEDQIRQQVAQRREAQLAAMVEGIVVTLPEGLTFSPNQSAQDRWLQRTLSQTGERLAAVRDRLFTLAQPQRHHLILDLNAGSGLLTWEAVRQVPEGGIYACVHSAADAAALQEQALALPELARPVILQTSVAELASHLQAQHPLLRFDRILGCNVLLAEADKAAILRSLLPWLHPDSRLILAETVAQQTQRLYRLVDEKTLGAKLYKRWVKAEEAIYQNPADPMVNWNEETLRSLFQTLNWNAEVQLEPTQTELQITPTLLTHWFNPGQQRPSYGDHLRRSLSETEISQIQDYFSRQLQHQVVSWTGAIAFISVRPVEV